MQKLLTNIILLLILIYQKTISLLFPGTCRFSPSCSNYMILSIKKHGLQVGIYMGIKRIAKCHPFSKANSWDPV